MFHDPDVSSEWNEVSLATASFGQRFTVTPLQELNMVCAIVDDGKLKQPYVVKQVLNADGSVQSTTETTVVRQVISEETSAYMREAMEQVVASGTGKNAYVSGYRIGGKTATSEILQEEGDTRSALHSVLHRRGADGRSADRGAGSDQRHPGIFAARRRRDRRAGRCAASWRRCCRISAYPGLLG